MGIEAERRFWQERDEYHELARQYDRNLEVTHPDFVTSRGMCPCLDYVNRCGWAITKVTYYEYRGPSIQSS